MKTIKADRRKLNFFFMFIFSYKGGRGDITIFTWIKAPQLVPKRHFLPDILSERS